MTQLYFKQLLVGRDVGKNSLFGKQMENFVYLIGDNETKECVVVDPAWDIQGIIDVASADDMKITGALATHYHPDHIGGDMMGMHIEGLSDLLAMNPCKIHAHKLEIPGIQKVTGLSKNDLQAHESGDTVSIGKVDVELLHTPGHTPGSICFRLKNALVSGDTLFLNGCGRVDLPGGDSEEMFRTMSERLSTLPDNLTVFPGHAYGGNCESLEHVRLHNPMLQARDLKTWFQVRGN